MSHPATARPSARRLLARWAIVFGMLVLSACGGGEEPESGTASSQAAKPLSSKSDRITIAVEKSGHHEVLVRWPLNSKVPDELPITISHGEGDHSFTLDRAGRNGQWVSLGAYPFKAGTTKDLVIRGEGGAGFGVESVRLDYLGADASAAAPRFEQSRLATALQHNNYEERLFAARGYPFFRYSLASGALPPGIELDGISGRLFGEPTEAGSWRFAIEVVDQAAQRVRQEFDLTVLEGKQQSRSPALASPPLVSSAKRRLDSNSVEGAVSRRLDLGAGEASATEGVGGLITTVRSMPEGSWKRLNFNTFDSVWTPPDLRQDMNGSDVSPSRIIIAWSSVAWDSRRSLLFLYGGGHANYRGNDTYIWRASTQLWERASLPSAMIQTPLGAWNAVDGAANAPASAHTYDNNIYLPQLDRVLVLGGAADSNGGHFFTQTSPSDSSLRKTGPYLFDTSRASPNKVGGSTGSHVQRVAPYPEILGGNMWSNRESWLHAASTTPPSEEFLEGCTALAIDEGRESVLVRTLYGLYRYTVGDLADPASDRWQRVGNYFGLGSGHQGACAYDPATKMLVGTHDAARPLIFWNLNAAGPTNEVVVVNPSDPSGDFAQFLGTGTNVLRGCGIEHDAVRGGFMMWCGGSRVWRITSPSTPIASGWVITPDPTPVGAVPTGSLGSGGVLGKWRYVPNLDVFISLVDPVAGDIWVYKPIGWVNPSPTPGNLPPTVTMTSPVDGSSVTYGASLALRASATDSDGSVSRVEFLVNGAVVGVDLDAPFEAVTTPLSGGAYIISARATDNDGAVTMSEPVAFVVTRPVCATEGGICTLPSGIVADVYFGANGQFSVRRGVAGSIACTRAEFGDPISGVVKRCEYEVTSTGGNLPPTVSITAPINGASLSSGALVTITANASDSDGTVSRIDFYDGASLIGTATSASRSLTARATDDDGAQGTSSAVVVNVSSGSSRIFCANEGGTCVIPPGITADVYYGANTTFAVRRSVTGSIACTNAVFGDPISGVAKRCEYESCWKLQQTIQMEQ